MTDTEILDFLEESIEERTKDRRWSPNYMVNIGTISFSVGPAQPLTFRELVKEARLKQITERLRK